MMSIHHQSDECPCSTCHGLGPPQLERRRHGWTVRCHECRETAVSAMSAFKAAERAGQWVPWTVRRAPTKHDRHAAELGGGLAILLVLLCAAVPGALAAVGVLPAWCAAPTVLVVCVRWMKLALDWRLCGPDDCPNCGPAYRNPPCSWCGD